MLLGKTTCEARKTWAGELSDFLETDEEFGAVRFGTPDVDTPGLIAFKRVNPWGSGLSALPHTSIWVGGGVDRLANRLRRFA